MQITPKFSHAPSHCASCYPLLPLLRARLTHHAPLTKVLMETWHFSTLRTQGHLAYCQLSVTLDTGSIMAIQSSKAPVLSVLTRTWR